jgi:methyl-accepting chemotaxis protein
MRIVGEDIYFFGQKVGKLNNATAADEFKQHFDELLDESEEHETEIDRLNKETTEQQEKIGNAVAGIENILDDHEVSDEAHEALQELLEEL